MVLVSGKSISQIDTKNKVVIDTEIARMIANDLVSGDVCKAEMKFVRLNLNLTQKKVAIKDSIILNLKTQNSNLNDIIILKDDMFSKQELISSQYKKDLVKARSSSFLYKVIAYVGIASTGYLLVTK